MLMKVVHEVLVRAGRLEGCQRKEDEAEGQEKRCCQYHEGAKGHVIQKCPDFLELVQKMMIEGELEFCGRMEEQNVSVLLKEETPKPFVIYYRGRGQ